MTTALLAAVATAAALVAVVTPAASARVVARPDLTVTSVTAPAGVRQGATLAVTTVVRNGGRADAKAGTVKLVLSRDTKVGGDRGLRPASRPVPLLRPARTSRATTRVVVPATTPVGTWYVLACVDPARRVRESKETNNCRASRGVRVTVLPSSQQLIEADVAAGRITERQGLVYRVFADFKDGRLPARYAGRPNGIGEGALGELADSWDTLPAATQDVVRPFLVPPYYAGSHWSPDTDQGLASGSARRAFDSPWCSGGSDVQPLFESWDHLDSTGGDVRIWWLKKNAADRLTALHYLDILENKILPALVTLMGRGPKGDGGGGLCDGGSDGLDIALVDATTATAYNNSGCGATGSSARILFPRTAAGAGWAGADPYLAHEVMHTIQFASPTAGGCSEYSWLREMTAEWVQDYVTDPAYGIGLAPDDTEFQAASIYLDDPGVPLEVSDSPLHHDYGDYLLPLWAVRKGGPSFVKEVWDAAAGLGPKEAVNAALPGGFEATWADFALSNWNRGPVHDYSDWDGLTAGAALSGMIQVGPTATQTASVPVSHLATQYVEVTLDPKIDELEITNNLVGSATAKMRAVISYSDGTHRVVDLSGRASTVLCVDDGTRKVTQLVLVMSNADLSADVTFKPTFTPSQTCGCPNATPLRGGTRATAAGPVCAGGIEFTWSDEYVGATPSIRDENGSTQGSGSLNLLLDPGGSAESGWFNAPGSTYQYSETGHHELRRHLGGDCFDETSDTTDTGSGELPELAAFVYLDPEGTDLVVPIGINMPVHHTWHNEVSCSSPQDDEGTNYPTLPPCLPDVPGTPADRYWEFEETAPGSGVYTFDCSGTVTYVDGGNRRHTVTVAASGTITLPD